VPNKDEDKWTEQDVIDVMLISIICSNPKSGMEPTIPADLDKEKIQRKLQNQGVPARAIVEFVERALDRGWIQFHEPYGYKLEDRGQAPR
jgi:hypothetical protein